MALGVLRWHWWVSRGLWGSQGGSGGLKVALVGLKGALGVLRWHWFVSRWLWGSQGGSGGPKVAQGVSRWLWGS